MSDLIEIGGSNPYQTTEHYLRRVLVGDVASVRLRIINALERLGYDVIDDDETVVRGRRGAAGWGTFYSSADVLDYPRTLVVKLKASGEHATRVTFDYLIKHPSLSKGEKDILTREAEAISSLATVRKVDKLCAACGTENTDDSRFCRKCGTPMTIESSELELLNMAAEVRAGYTSVVTAEIVLAASILSICIGLGTALVKGLEVGRGVAVFLIIGVVLALLDLVFLGFGWNRMRRSLQRKPTAPPRSFEQPIQMPFIQGSNLNDPQLPPPSVTDGTTSLFDRGNPVPTRSFSSDNGPITLSDLNDQ